MKVFAVFCALVLGGASLACDHTALVGAQNLPPDGSPRLPTGADAGGPTGTAGTGGGSTGTAGTGGGGSSAPSGADAGSTGAPTGTYAAAEGIMWGGPGQPGPWLFFDSLRSLNRDIYAVRVDGTSMKRLTTSPAIEREPAISPDGATLAFSSDAGGTFQLYLMPLATGVPRQLTRRADGAEQPAWSPDGRTLAFGSGRAIILIDADGTNERVAKYSVGDFNPCRHPVFTPDGRSLVYDLLEGTFLYELAVQEETTIVGAGRHPSVSSDGATVAFFSTCGQGDHPQGTYPVGAIWLAPLARSPGHCAGRPVTTFADGNARAPALSPEGRIAFEHGGLATRIGIVGAGGGAVEDITSGGDDRNPTWSPASLVLP